MSRAIFEVPIVTVSESNRRDHWSVKARRVREQRAAVAWARRRADAWWEPLSSHPDRRWTVSLTRLAPRRLDSDNLRGALKAVRDEVAALLCIDDGDSRVTWVYAQERAREPGVRIEIEEGACSTRCETG